MKRHSFTSKNDQKIKMVYRYPKQKKKIKVNTFDHIESIKMYSDIVVSVVKRLTNEGFNFLTGKYEKTKSVTKQEDLQ